MQSLQSVREKVGTEEIVVLYFSTPSCQVCQALKLKLLPAIRSEFPGIIVELIDCAAAPDIAAQYGVFTVPAVLVFIQGKEVVRRSRHVGMAETLDAIRRPYDILRSAKLGRSR